MKLKLISMATIFVLSGVIVFLSPVYSQPNDSLLPVILIHGYRQDASVWETWEGLLDADGIPYLSITFTESDDECGSARDHALELSQTVQEFLTQTGMQQLNLVGFSKGGIDARVYLQGGTDDVANLIMIGAPNAGSPLAEMYNDVGCMPAATDLRPGSAATRARENTNTDYYTISGDWRYWYFWMLVEGNSEIEGPDDGWVPVSSVESLRYSDILGRTSSYHTDLLGPEEYSLAREVLTK
jgi:pimeloyl-ACP methyl ester carboxylesterase